MDTDNLLCVLGHKIRLLDTDARTNSSRSFMARWTS